MKKLRLIIKLKCPNFDCHNLQTCIYSFISEFDQLLLMTECGFMCISSLLSDIFRGLNFCSQVGVTLHILPNLMRPGAENGTGSTERKACCEAENWARSCCPCLQLLCSGYCCSTGIFHLKCEDLLRSQEGGFLVPLPDLMRRR